MTTLVRLLGLGLLAGLITSCSCPFARSNGKAPAPTAPARVATNAGICLHVGAGNGDLSAQFAKSPRLIVHAELTDTVPRDQTLEDAGKPAELEG